MIRNIWAVNLRQCFNNQLFIQVGRVHYLAKLAFFFWDCSKCAEFQCFSSNKMRLFPSTKFSIGLITYGAHNTIDKYISDFTLEEFKERITNRYK